MAQKSWLEISAENLKPFVCQFFRIVDNKINF